MPLTKDEQATLDKAIQRLQTDQGFAQKHAKDPGLSFHGTNIPEYMKDTGVALGDSAKTLISIKNGGSVNHDELTQLKTELSKYQKYYEASRSTPDEKQKLIEDTLKIIEKISPAPTHKI